MRAARRWPVWAAAIAWGVFAIPLCFWGLPSRANDGLLFGGKPAWSAAAFGADTALRELRDRQAGADTDANPVADRRELVDLTPDEAARAAILLRYRLYSHQPDEMITFRALQRMKPRQGDFDPKLYQYGGAYIYGVGGAIGAASLVGAATLTRDLGRYLDHPEDFGRFYLIARMLSIAFAVVGLVACHRIAARAGSAVAGWLAMLLVGLSPVFISGAVEAKPHIPSVCMTLLAIERGLTFLDRPTRRNAIGLGCCAGLAAGLVLTGFAAFLVLPAVWLTAWRDRKQNLRPLLLAGATAIAIYLLTNPYVIVNALANPESLRSNIGNSTSMYTIARLGEGAVRVGELLWEALGGWMLLVGIAGIVLYSRIVRSRMLVIGLPAAAMLALCAAIGAGKPAEFARFLALPAAALAIGAAAFFRQLLVSRIGGAAAVGALAIWIVSVCNYPVAFFTDGWRMAATRRAAAEWIRDNVPAAAAIGVFQEPAPYSIPPIDFVDRSVLLLPDRPPHAPSPLQAPDWIVVTVDDRKALEHYGGWLREFRVAWETKAVLDNPTPITWANKPVVILHRDR